jgi:hypothetical protein
MGIGRRLLFSDGINPLGILAMHFKAFYLPQLNATPNEIASKQLDL